MASIRLALSCFTYCEVLFIFKLVYLSVGEIWVRIWYRKCEVIKVCIILFSTLAPYILI